MGHVKNSVKVDVLLSNHNSVNDDLDFVRWEWMLRDIAVVVQRYYGSSPDDVTTYGPPIGNNGERKWEMFIDTGHSGHFFLPGLEYREPKN